MNFNQSDVMAKYLKSHPEDRVARLAFADSLEEAGELARAKEQRLYAERRLYYEEARFSNMYDVFVVPSSMRERFEAAFPDATRIDRKEAIRRGWVRPRQARREREQWWGGFRDGPEGSGDTLDEALLAACIATVYAVEAADREVCWGEGELGE